MTEAQTAALVVYDGTINALNDILSMREEEIRLANQLNKELATQESIVKEIVAVERIARPAGFEGLALADSTAALTLKPIDMGSTTLSANQMSAFWVDFATKAQRANQLIESVSTSIGSTLQNLATTMAEGLGDVMSGLSFDPGMAFIEVLGKSLKSLGSMLVTYATTMEAFKESLKTIFINPWTAIALGAGAIALGQLFINSAQQPIKLANGGLAYGPTLAVVGDNRGAASDPEVIAPLSKLRNYMGGQQMELVGGVTFELRGDVARAIIDRENVRLSRKG